MMGFLIAQTSSTVLLLAPLLLQVVTSQLVGQPPPLPDSGVRLYLGLSLTTIPVFSMVNAADFRKEDTANNDGINDGLWCQSANNINNVGTWYYDGAPVTTNDAAGNLHAYNDATGQVGLLRDGHLSGIEGLYTCTILDEFNVSQTLSVALYKNNEYNTFTAPVISGPMVFSLLSTRDVSPPLFTLSYTVTTRLPTTVTCTVNGAPLSIDDLDHTVLTSTSVNVTVTISNRTSGSYQCTVQSTVGPAVMTDALTITTTGAPTDVKAERTGLATTEVTWSAPVSNDPAIKRYKIFYDGGSATVNSPDTSVTIMTNGLLPNETYDVFVVAYSNGHGDTLPSEPINTIIPQVVTFNITTSGELVVGATDTNITCTVTIDVPVDELQIALFADVVDTVAVEPDPDLDSDFVTVALPVLETQNAGIYICGASVFDNATMTGFNISEMYALNISINVPAPAVSVMTYPSDAVLLIGTYIDIDCTATISDAIDTAIDVVAVWTQDGGPSLDNTSAITISPVTMVSSTVYRSRLRINQLMANNNNDVFQCTVTIQPLTPYITGISGDDTLTLSVAELTQDNFKIVLDIPSAPTAGEVAILSCNIVPPDRFVLNLDSILWAYDAAGTMRIEMVNPNAALGPLVSEAGGNFSRNITLDPVKTSDAKRYFCDYAVGVINTSDFSDLTVQIPSPDVSVSRSPSSGPIYESTILNLTCTATVPSVVDTAVSAAVVWTNISSGSVIANTDYLTFSLPQQVETNTFESTLMFNPVDIDNMEYGGFNSAGNYECQITVSNSSLPDNGEILDGVSSNDFDFTVDVLPPMGLSISSVGSTEVGQSLYITCTVTVVKGLVVQPTVVWTKMDDVSVGDINELNIPNVTVTEGGVINVTIMLEPVKFEHRGMYYCMHMGMFNVTGITNDAQDESSDYSLTVSFPPVNLTISQSYTDTLYSGTPLNITCDLELPALVDIPVMVSKQWTTTDNANIPSADDTTITDGLTSSNNLQHTATLSFYPLNVTDSRGYQCNLMIVANDTTGNNFVNPFNVMDNASIVVEVLPIPTVDILTSGNELVGNTFMLTCTVGVVDRLIVEPDTIWTKELNDSCLLSDDKFTTISVASVRNDNVLSLNFTSLNTSDAARYTCTATLDITLIDVAVTYDSYTDIVLQIPEFKQTVNIFLSRDDDVLAGSHLTITCDVDVDDQVDLPIYVVIKWTMSGSPLTSNDRITVGGVDETGFNQYRSQVSFSTLSSTHDSGIYSCTVNVTSDDSEDCAYVEDANVVEEFTALNVTDPMIGNFTVTPDSFLGLETGTSCPNTSDYDDVTLTCTASKPLLVVPPLMVRWIRDTTNGSQPQNDTLGSVTVSNGGTFVTNTLTFPTSMANDSGTYVCYAALGIPDSDIIMISGSSNVTFRAASLPNVPVVMNVSITATTATISYLITAIAYAPERYRVEYQGLELQPYINVTDFTYSSTDIAATNQPFTVTLTGLEEANTYEFVVVAVNCLGNITTRVINFTTEAALPIGEPINCGNTTFLPRNTSLTWQPPVRVLQNGLIWGYYLNCTNSIGGVVSGTESTQTSSNTMFTIPVLMPFTDYTCQLASINEVGEGPRTTCQFMTAQDRPDTPPDQFSSIPNAFDVLFMWEEPVVPNGIIVSYTITITNINTSVTTTNVIEELYFNLTGFKSYQSYVAFVTAATVVGDGPPAVTSGRTNLHIPPPLVSLYFSTSTVNDTFNVVCNVTVGLNVNVPLSAIVVCYNSDSINVINEVKPLSNNHFVSVFPYDNSHMYTCRVRITSSTQNSTATIHSTSISLFQLRISGFSTCLQWTARIENSVTMFIRSAVIDAIRQSCSQCGFSEQFINGEELICEESNPLEVVYRAHIMDYGSLSSSELVDIIEQWVVGGATATTDFGVVVMFDVSCPISINSINDSVCQQPSTIGVSNTIVLIGAVVLIIFTLLIIAAAVVIAFKLRRMIRWNLTESHDHEVDIELEMSSNAAYGPVSIKTDKGEGEHTYEHVDHDGCLYELMDLDQDPTTQGSTVKVEDNENAYEIMENEDAIN